MITFNVFGCCVSRDSLALLEAQKSAVILQMVSPTTATLFTRKFERVYTIDDFKEYDTSKYFKRLFVQDLNKTHLDYLTEKKSDYLIIDLLNERLSILEKDGRSIAVGAFYNENQQRLTDEFDLKTYNLRKLGDIDINTRFENLDRFCSYILKYYTPNQIIIHRFKGVECYKDKTRKKLFAPDIRKFVQDYNSITDQIYEYVIQKLKGCHVINSPDDVIADVEHKWGLMPLHFHKFYYDYVSKAIMIICKHLPCFDEMSQLEELRRIYSEKFELLNLKLELTSKNDLLTWSNNSVNFSKALLFDMLSDNIFISNLKRIKERSLRVSVLKSTDVAGVILLKALQEFNIDVVFKSHLWQLQWLNSADFEKCRQADLIISADVHGAPPNERDGVAAIMISDLLKINFEENENG